MPETDHTERIVEETHETIYSPPPVRHHHHVVHVPTPPPAPPVNYRQGPEIIQVDPPRAPPSTELVTTKGVVYEERFLPSRHHRSRSMGPTPRHEEYVESTSLALAPVPSYGPPARYDGRIVRVERIEDDYRRGDEGEVVLFDRDDEEPVAAVRRDRKGRMSLIVPKRYR